MWVGFLRRELLGSSTLCFANLLLDLTSPFATMQLPPVDYVQWGSSGGGVLLILFFVVHSKYLLDITQLFQVTLPFISFEL